MSKFDIAFLFFIRFIKKPFTHQDKATTFQFGAKILFVD